MTLGTNYYSCGLKRVSAYFSLQVCGIFTSWIDAITFADVFDSMLQFMLDRVIHLLRLGGFAHTHYRQVVFEVGESKTFVPH